MNTLMDTLYIAWTIATKDIQDALKNKNMRTNIILMLGMVVFFYWLGTLRPFDKNVSVVVYDEGNTSLTLDAVTLGDGAEYTFREASSLPEMEKMMANQNLGLILPADFDQELAAGGTPTLNGAVFWVERLKVAELERKYSQAFSEILGQHVQVVIGKNILVPQADSAGSQNTAAYQMVYFIFWTALALIPYLMLEEKQTRTLDALLTSPASPGQVILGKALAGFFYLLIIGGLAMVLYRNYFVHWGLALAAFLGYCVLAVGLGLVLGIFIKSTQQLRLWSLMLILFLVIPPLFFMESNLKAGIRKIFTWMPSSALASLFRFSCSSGVTPAQLWPNLLIAVLSIAAVFALIIWKVRRSDR